MTTATAQAPSRAPTPLPKAKAASTAIVTSESATAIHSRSPSTESLACRPTLPAAHRSRVERRAPLDPLSDVATANLIRRTLYPQHADKGRSATPVIGDVLPPLTSRNDVDLQLYALLAIVLRECVQNWYQKITPDDRFVAEIVQITAHCTRALEQRLRKVDLESLLLDEMPELLDKHMTAFRAARNAVSRPPVQTDLYEVYHSMCPLPALSPIPKPGSPWTVEEQAENEAAYRQLLVHGVLAVLLPTEDLDNDCLTALVGQIFSELMIGNVVANKLAEPWMVWECLIILARILKPKITRAKGWSTGGSSSVQTMFWRLVHWCFATMAFFRFVATTVMLTWSLPSRNKTRGKAEGAADVGPGHSDTCNNKIPVLAFQCWPVFAKLVELDVRMPWLCGAASMLQWLAMVGPGRIATVNGVLDRLLSHCLCRSALDPDSLPALLRTARGLLFPNNMPGPSTLVAPASERELLALRRRCASALLDLLPRGVGPVYFGGRGPLWAGSGGSTEAAQLQEEKTRMLCEIEEGILDVFGDAYCNKHLMYLILELVLVRLMPELTQKGVTELLAERL